MQSVLTVSQLTRAISEALASGVGPCRVEGEVASFTAARSGHWYFDLKDEGAVLSCVMFRGRNRTLPAPPRVGDRIVVAGALDVYAPRGRYNLIVRTLARAGAGDLQARLEALKRKLAAEGLFDPSRKRPLPSIPRGIGVVTSATGAALHDILKVLRRRFPGVPVYLAASRVQGSEAPREIIAAIALLNAHAKADVLIVGRGGGSQEDLMAFNDESVARAIAASGIPVVSAVGHEVDVSIADLVADARAATPSHAAELVVPEREGLLLVLDDLDLRLRNGVARLLAQRRDRLGTLVLRHPRRQIADARQRVAQHAGDLRRTWVHDQRRRHVAVRGAAGRLEALSPVAVLGRGYAVALHEGRAVKDPTALQEGAELEVRLHAGSVDATVTRVRPD
ncbi:MAG: exodeoxyribonuclease VII large subunit [Myxococcota bacterium]|nr:exodeoxyribonuclease VII large subunit [Myxococcota bacterium]